MLLDMFEVPLRKAVLLSKSGLSIISSATKLPVVSNTVPICNLIVYCATNIHMSPLDNEKLLALISRIRVV